MAQLIDRPNISEPGDLPSQLYAQYAARYFPEGTNFKPHNERILLASNIPGLADYLRIGLILPDPSRNFPENAISLTFPAEIPLDSILPKDASGQTLQLYDKNNLEMAILVPQNVAEEQHLNGGSMKLNDILKRLDGYVEARKQDMMGHDDRKYGNVQLLILTRRIKVARERGIPYAFKSSARVPGYDALVINTLTPQNKAGDIITELLKRIGANFNGSNP